jgi:hypothetical protein
LKDKKVIISILLIILIVSSAYSIERYIKENGTAKGEILEISDDQQTIAYISGDIIMKLLENDDLKKHTGDGLSLNSLLNSVGAYNYTKIEIKNRNSTLIIPFSATDFDKNYYIKYTSTNNMTVVLKNNGKCTTIENISNIHLIK